MGGLNGNILSKAVLAKPGFTEVRGSENGEMEDISDQLFLIDQFVD